MQATAPIDGPARRRASRDQLSLALMDARNHTLQLLAQFEQALGPELSLPSGVAAASPVWVAGHVAWLAEAWIARNPQRGMGARCPADALRIASIEPNADRWFDPRMVPPAARSASWLPGCGAIKAYLLETLELTLELLDKTADTDDGLHFFRMALFHEDLRGEQLVVLAQSAGVSLRQALPVGAQALQPLLLPATRWSLGWTEPGFALDVERGSEPMAVPEFEIDAQPVTWSQYSEFTDDGGYDRPELWDPRGWAWLQEEAQREGRRGPRHVEQIGEAGGAVLQSWFGKPTRMGATQAVMHASWWEADAFARWSGRRLPTEAEWEIAAHAGARRGFRWGQVHEWTAGTLRPWSGFAPAGWAASAELDAQPVFGVARVLRGASFAAHSRMHHPRARGWALPERDDGFVGFRTCAV